MNCLIGAHSPLDSTLPSPSSISLIFPDHRCRRAARSLALPTPRACPWSVTFSGCLCSGSSVRLASCRSTHQTQTGAAQFGRSRHRALNLDLPLEASSQPGRIPNPPRLDWFPSTLICHRIHRKLIGLIALIRSNHRHSTLSSC